MTPTNSIVSRDSIDTDVCIVGSGVAGAIVARDCCRQGMDVVVVEAGTEGNGRALPLRVLEKVVRDYRIPRMWWHRHAKYGKRDYESVGNRRYPLRGLALVARGGSTLGWTGDAYRLKPEDFELASRTGQGMDWPIGYHDLSPFYDLAEHTLGVSGDNTDVGHPPRNGQFPVSTRPFHVRDEPFRKTLADRGWSSMHHNIAMSRKGGVFTGDQVLDEFQDLPNFHLLLGHAALRLQCASRGRVAAVECHDSRRGRTLRVGAQTVVVAAGGIETPTLLLRSANPMWPSGIGNDTGHVGRYLSAHTGLAIGGRLRSRWRNGPVGATVATRQFDSEKDQASGKYLLIWRPAPSGLLFVNAILEQFPGPDSRVEAGRGITVFGTPRPVISFHHTDCHREIAASVWDVVESVARQCGLSSSFTRRFIHAHPMCTCRMSDDLGSGVTDSNLLVHETDNLYLCGSAVFSSGGAANPTVTIAALAHRLGQRLSGRDMPYSRSAAEPAVSRTTVGHA